MTPLTMPQIGALKTLWGFYDSTHREVETSWSGLAHWCTIKTLGRWSILKAASRENPYRTTQEKLTTDLDFLVEEGYIGTRKSGSHARERRHYWLTKKGLDTLIDLKEVGRSDRTEALYHVIENRSDHPAPHMFSEAEVRVALGRVLKPGEVDRTMNALLEASSQPKSKLK